MCGLSYQPLPHNVGGAHYPIVFNNACSSWRALAIRFSSAGASVYVGTATDILNSVGLLTANQFASEITSGRAVGLALYRAQKKYVSEFEYTPYLMTGYLYTKLNNPSLKRPHRRVALRIFDAIKAVERLPSVRGKSAMLKFLKDELHALNDVKMQITESS